MAALGKGRKFAVGIMVKVPRRKNSFPDRFAKVFRQEFRWNILGPDYVTARSLREVTG